MLTIPPLLRDNFRGEKSDFLHTEHVVLEVVALQVLFFLMSVFFCFYNYYWHKRFVPQSGSRFLNGVIVFVVNISISLIISLVLGAIMSQFVDLNLNQSRAGFMFGRVLFASLFSLLVSYILNLINRTKISEIENARLKEKVMASQLASLKEQVNPHFLFNTLNSLSSVIRQDEKEKSLEFVDRLALVYRYILASQEKNLININEELKFINDYVYLLKTRFNDKLQVVVDEMDSNKQAVVPPLALQLLVENAVHHNVMSTMSPLIIEITFERENIVVRNNLKKKSSSESFGIGLANLSKRYDLIAQKDIKIIETEAFFTVKLPWINNEDINS
jgi:sensor histidine kinase YesM